MLSPSATLGFCNWVGMGGGRSMYVSPPKVRRGPTALSENFEFWSQLEGGG